MFLNDLYTFSEIEQIADHSFGIRIVIRADHRIFAGHFPGQPVLPGVCILEMLKDAVAENTGKPVRLIQASSIKYLKVIDPGLDAELKMHIEIKQEGEMLLTTATSYTKDGTAHFKFKGQLQYE